MNLYLTMAILNVKFIRLFSAVLCLIHVCCGNLNIYLNQNEVMRLLGLSAELFYVREGLVNEYALHFTVPVPATMDSLAFSWQSLAGRPLPYSLSVDVSDRVAVPNATFNISRTGNVPSAGVETFAVTLACSGAVAAEVDVTIFVNVTLSRHDHADGGRDNVTALAFRRRKICLLGVKGDGMDPSHAVHVDSLPQSSDRSAAEGLLYLSLGGAAALGAVCAVFGAVYCSRAGAKSRPTPPSGAPSPPLPLLHEEKSSCVVPGAARNFTGGTLMSTTVNERSKEQRLQDKIAEITIQRCRIRLRCLLQEGTFGRVYRGTYAEEQPPPVTGAGSSSSSSTHYHQQRQETEVLVKTVAEHASQQQQVSLLLQEGLGLYGLHHPHLLTVLGVSIEDCTAPFIVYRQGHNHCNLKKALLAHKPHHHGTSTTATAATYGGTAGFIRRAVTTSDLVLMALQLSRALAYMHGEGCLHTDVATRNCVIDENLHVRLGDRALSRDLFPDDYHCLGDNENRPVKWLSLEALTHQRRVQNGPSDVWSFGVLLWELMTLAEQPYADIDPYEMAAYLRDGYRLTQPINCPDELFAVMAYCWALNADERPTFAQLQICLQEFYTQLTLYV